MLTARRIQSYEEHSMSNDDIIIGEIHAALVRHPRIPHPAEVAVSSREGTVTLRGCVGSFHQRQAAVKVARSVESLMSKMSCPSTYGIARRTTGSGD